jgi:small subunit ribosomal protein S19
MSKIKFCSKSSINIRKVKKKIFSRDSFILDYHVGEIFYVHNGNKFVPVSVNSRMKGFRFGDFCLTRKQFSYKKKNE